MPSIPTLITRDRLHDLAITLERLPHEDEVATPAGCRETYQVTANVLDMTDKGIPDRSIDAYATRYIAEMEKAMKAQNMLPAGTRFEDCGIDDCNASLRIHLPAGGDDPREMTEILAEEDAKLQQAFGAAHKAAVQQVGPPPQPRRRTSGPGRVR